MEQIIKKSYQVSGTIDQDTVDLITKSFDDQILPLQDDVKIWSSQIEDLEEQITRLQHSIDSNNEDIVNIQKKKDSTLILFN